MALMPSASEIVRLAAGFLGQTAVLTGLLFYFGWARSATSLGYFGVEVSLAQLSTSDYLLRSTGTALPPLILGSLIVAALVVAGRIARHYLTRLSRRRIWSVALAVQSVAVLLVIVGAYSSYRRPSVHLAPSVRPLLVSIGLLTAAVGWQLLDLVTRTPIRPSRVIVLLLLTAGAGCLLWSWSLYATQVGVSRAEDFAADLPRKESIALYSRDRLAIAGPGVEAVPLEGTGSSYIVRYDGLRLLMRAGDGDLFLLPKGWRKGRDPVFQIKNDDRVRMDVVARSE
jgi:hypothetical protein